MLTAEHLRSILSYDPATGLFRWLWDVDKKPNINSRDTKKVAGTIKPNGRRYIKINGTGRLCSRLAWLYVYGDWPSGEIDHINGRPADDRIANLRSCTRSENQHNVGLTARNSSGRKGVHWAKRYHRWEAEISIAGRKIYLGRFDDLDEAGAAYAAAARLHHGEFARID